MMLGFFGYAIIFIVAVVLICAYPLTAFARGMASNPSAHKRSKGGCMASLIGLALIGWWVWEVIL